MSWDSYETKDKKRIVLVELPDLDTPPAALDQSKTDDIKADGGRNLGSFSKRAEISTIDTYAYAVLFER